MECQGQPRALPRVVSSARSASPAAAPWGAAASAASPSSALIQKSAWRARTRTMVGFDRHTLSLNAYSRAGARRPYRAGDPSHCVRHSLRSSCPITSTGRGRRPASRVGWTEHSRRRCLSSTEPSLRREGFRSPGTRAADPTARAQDAWNRACTSLQSAIKVSARPPI